MPGKTVLSKLETRVIEALQTSPMLMAMALDPHQLMIASSYMRQEGAKSLSRAYQECALHCPPGYLVEEDTRLTLFLTEYEVMVRGAHLFSNHVLYAEAYRQYMKAVAASDSKSQMHWFDQLCRLASKVGGREPGARRRISL